MRALFDTYGAMLGHAILVHTGYVLICVTVMMTVIGTIPSQRNNTPINTSPGIVCKTEMTGSTIPDIRGVRVRVELPLAMPTIIAGLRMSAIYTVSWTVLAAMIGLELRHTAASGGLQIFFLHTQKAGVGVFQHREHGVDRRYHGQCLRR